ncbi:MAG TPA: dTDP-4-amino-4,6-dideoxygalactose transaminase [Solirubrobacteraceae bacterium]|jgi:dTDP-4-amino-4,6-dideoxygalactose transaminase|nr:dTDP-4-amino-4,6-dideoxygalactose transaminase [Solirubrobacteraceae bacterium]
MNEIVFNRPHPTGREFDYIGQAIARGYLSGNGPFSQRCAAWLQERTGSPCALLTTSCSSALEMAVLLSGIGPGDEVIMPSYTFVSGANAVALRGATPVFVDIRPDTLNLDERLLEDAITPRTRAILPTHYAGVACEMDAIVDVASRHGLLVIEDAAQGVLASYGDRPLGTIGTLGCLSFHETKNVTCGEGGALLVNDRDWIERAEIAHEKGTDRRRFFRGEVDKYKWVDLGSSFLPSDISAAFLWAQLEEADRITARRLEIWRLYHERFAEAEARGRLRRPVAPQGCRHNAHMYYLLASDRSARDALIAALAEQGIMAVFHYVPLHSSPAGRRLGRAAGDLRVTDEASDRILRLPLWVGLGDRDVERIAGAVLAALS